MASHQKLRRTIESHHWRWSSYKFTSSCQIIQCLSYNNCLAFEANWKVEKAQKGGASWTDHKSKISSIWSVISYSTQQRTISWSDCDMQQKMDFIWQSTMTSSVIGPRRSLKALHRAKLGQKKITVTVWGSAVHLIHYSFLNPGEIFTSEKCAQQVNEVHQQLHCLQLALVNRKGPALLHNNTWLHNEQPVLQKVERIRLQSFASSTIFTWPFIDQLPLIQASQQHFTGKILPQPTGYRKCIARIHQIPKHRFLCAGISKLICCWQKCVDCNGFYFDD